MKKHTTIPVKSMKFDNQDGNNYSVNLNVKNDTKAGISSVKAEKIPVILYNRCRNGVTK